ncbi:sulfur carrier protein ThiS adenylyltransferase ThiF [Desulfurispora thermophila]|uniref:sulfur carrier protein ThiS adenylyltransferase ThiF n=1 Tax=Desulfurispora thermophila TaxID=265470 RepID=UPI000374EF84
MEDILAAALAGMVGEANLAVARRVKIGIAGAGGLGSNCAQFLVRSGFTRLKIVDYDRVEVSNLNRQFYFAHQVGRLKVEALGENLAAINPHLQLELLPVKIQESNVGELFADCDALVEALDRAETKRLLVETYWNTGKLLVAASGLAGWGRVDAIAVHRIKDNFFLVGDRCSEVSAQLPPVAPAVVTAAAKQADVVVSYFWREKNKNG